MYVFTWDFHARRDHINYLLRWNLFKKNHPTHHYTFSKALKVDETETDKQRSKKKRHNEKRVPPNLCFFLI